MCNRKKLNSCRLVHHGKIQDALGPCATACNCALRRLATLRGRGLADMVAGQSGRQKASVGLGVVTVGLEVGHEGVETVAAVNRLDALKEKGVDVTQIVVKRQQEGQHVKGGSVVLFALENRQGEFVKCPCFLEDFGVNAAVDAFVTHGGHVVEDRRQQVVKHTNGRVTCFAINQIHETMQAKAIVGRYPFAAVKGVNDFIERNRVQRKYITCWKCLTAACRSSILDAGQVESDGIGAVCQTLECFFRSALENEVNGVRAHLLQLIKGLLTSHGAVHFS